MNKKLEEKILAELRNKAIEKDRERKNEQEIKEMREANIEALTELTSLSRKELEEIADNVKKEYLIKVKIKQKRIMQYAALSLVVLVILYFVFRPAPELKSRIVEDNFNDNSYEWSVFNTYTYNRYFKDNQYIIETNNDGWCYWDGIKMEFPKNYDIEVASKWLNGKYSAYGIGLHQSDTAYFAFSIRGDGAASFGKVLSGKWVIDDSWKDNMANKGKNQINIQKVEVRDKNFNYYINNKLIRTGIFDLDFKEADLHCCGIQQVAYDYIKITNTDSKKVIFEDDFSKPSDQWKPSKNYTCESRFEKGKYIFNVNYSNNCYWSTSGLHKITGNCEVELTSTWLTGELANYGLMILKDDDNYYSFEMQNNGEARFVECKLDKYTYVQNFVKTPCESDGKKAYTQKIVIKGGEISYFVNGDLINKYTSSIEYPCKIALRMCGKQSVEFDNLKMKYFE